MQNKARGTEPRTRLALNAIVPCQTQLRDVSFRIACRIVKYAKDNNLGRNIPDDKIEETVRAATWYPEYVPVIPRED